MSEAKVNDAGLTFEQWYAKANEECEAICGLGLDDLADGPSYDAWDDGTPPAEYAQDRLLDEGFPFE